MSTPTGVHALVRRTHEDRIIDVLRTRGALSRGEIADLVGLSRTTLSEITGSLLARGAIIVVDTDAGHREGSGRPAERLALDPASGQYMGVDFGHVRVHVAIADASHEIIASDSARYDDDADWAERLDVAFQLLDRIAEARGIHFGALQAIGIGVPGPFISTAARRSAVGWRDRLPADGVDTAFTTRFGAPVIVDNNTRFAALAEAIGSAGGAVQDLVYVRLSDGVGGGLVIGGRLVTGSAGLAGELGHVTVDPSGSQCRCGKTGCLETVASVPAILAECRARGVAVHTLDDLAVEVGRAHPIVDGVLRDVGAALGLALGAAAMTLNPESVVIGGAITRVAPDIVRYTEAAIRYQLWSIADAAPSIRAAALSDSDGALGAIAALFHQSPLLAGYPEPTAAPMSEPTRRSSL